MKLIDLSLLLLTSTTLVAASPFGHSRFHKKSCVAVGQSCLENGVANADLCCDGNQRNGVCCGNDGCSCKKDCDCCGGTCDSATKTCGKPSKDSGKGSKNKEKPETKDSNNKYPKDNDTKDPKEPEYPEKDPEYPEKDPEYPEKDPEYPEKDPKDPKDSKDPKDPKDPDYPEDPEPGKCKAPGESDCGADATNAKTCCSSPGISVNCRNDVCCVPTTEKSFTCEHDGQCCSGYCDPDVNTCQEIVCKEPGVVGCGIDHVNSEWCCLPEGILSVNCFNNRCCVNELQSNYVCANDEQCCSSYCNPDTSRCETKPDEPVACAATLGESCNASSCCASGAGKCSSEGEKVCVCISKDDPEECRVDGDCCESAPNCISGKCTENPTPTCTKFDEDCSVLDCCEGSGICQTEVGHFGVTRTCKCVPNFAEEIPSQESNIPDIPAVPGDCKVHSDCCSEYCGDDKKCADKPALNSLECGNLNADCSISNCCKEGAGTCQTDLSGAIAKKTCLCIPIADTITSCKVNSDCCTDYCDGVSLTCKTAPAPKCLETNAECSSADECCPSGEGENLANCVQSTILQKKVCCVRTPGTLYPGTFTKEEGDALCCGRWVDKSHDGTFQIQCR